MRDMAISQCIGSLLAAARGTNYLYKVQCNAQDAMYLDKQTYRRNRLYDCFFIRASTRCRETFNE